ncbi:5'-nucleotidase C-terminal domain-containing protein, partial [Zoogloea sp. LCSB751]
KAGNITYRDVLTVQPFGNMVTLNEMTGAAAADYLGAVGSLQIGSGGYAQITGVKMTIDCVAKKATVHEINGKEFSATANYKFTVPSFN